MVCMNPPSPSLVLEIDDMTFEPLVLGSDVPFLLDVSSRWCGPCKVLEPVLRSVAAELAGQLRVGKLDLEAAPDVSRRLAIRGTPTLVLFAAGKEVRRRIGSTSAAGVRELCRP